MMLSSVRENMSTTSHSFVQVLTQEHGRALEDTGPFHGDTEYMKLNELKYTLKRYSVLVFYSNVKNFILMMFMRITMFCIHSVRANVAMKMFESFTRPASFTTKAGEGPNSGKLKEKLEEKHVDCNDMASRREHLDSLISILDEHITARVHSEPTEVGHCHTVTVFCSALFCSVLLCVARQTD